MCLESYVILNDAVIRDNVFMHKGMDMLVFSYNKASMDHNNTFYVVRHPYLTVERIILVHLPCLRRAFPRLSIQRVLGKLQC